MILRFRFRYAMTLFILSALAKADNFVVFHSRAIQNPTDFVDWTQLGPDGTELTTPQLVSAFNGNLALVGNTDGSDFFRADEGSSWTGNFDFGESLLWTGNANNGFGGIGPMAIVLQNPAASFGFDIQAQLAGPFTATVDALDPLRNLLFTDTFAGVSNNLENESALFIGLGDTTGVNIGAIVISTDSGSANPTFANDFAIDDPSFTYTTAVPEPSSLALLGVALLGITGALRRGRRKEIHPRGTL